MLFKSAALAAAVLSFISTSSAQAGVATVYRYVGGTATIYADYCPCPTQGLGGAGTGSGSGSSGTGSGSSGVAAPGSGTGSSGTGSSGTGGSGGVVVVPGGSGSGAVPGANGGGVIVGPGSQPGFQVYVSISVGISVGVTTSTFVNNGATFTSVVTTTATVTTPVTMTSAINGGGAGVGPIGTSTTPGGGTSTTIGSSSSTPLFSNSTISSTSSSRPVSVSLTTSASSTSASGTTSTGPIGTSTTPGAGTSTTSTSSTATPTSSSSSASSSSSSSSTSTTSSAAPAGTLANVVAFIQYDNGQVYGSTLQSVQPVNGQPSSAIAYYIAALQDVNNPVPSITYTDPTVEFYVTIGTGTNFFNATGSFQGYSPALISSGTNQVIQPFGNTPAAGTGASYAFNVVPATAGDPLNTSGYQYEIVIPNTIFYLTGSTTIGVQPGTAFNTANPPADNSGQTSQLKLYFAPVAGGSQTAGRPPV